MAPEVPAGPPNGGPPAERVDVVPLLKSYRSALVLARRPPQSLAVPARLWRLLRRLRPSWGAHYFMTRYVRRRTVAVERALSGRTAVGEGDDNDDVEADALRQFQASLMPPPSRLLTVIAFIAAVLLSQALVGWLFSTVEEFRSSTDDDRVRQALEQVNLTPDVKSFGDIVDALTSADFLELGFLLVAVMTVAYMFGRPLASGYRLAYYCSGRPERLSAVRRRSPLRMQACALEIPEQEGLVARVTGAELRREAPLDLLVKAALWIAVAYWLVGLIRFDGSPHVEAGGFILWLVVCAAVLGGLARLASRVATRWLLAAWVVAIGVAALLFVALVELGSPDTRTGDWVWLGFFGACVARLLWLAWKAASRGSSVWWIVGPLAVACIIAVAASDPADVITDDDARADAMEYAGAGALPRLSRSDLQVMLATHRDLSGADLRGQDLHGFLFTDKKLARASLALADMRDAVLLRTNLREASLPGALLTRAYLVGADLRGADLRCADLRDAVLDGANLQGAVLGGAVASEKTAWPAGFDRSGQRIQKPSVLDQSGLTGKTALYTYSEYFCAG